MTVSSGPLTVTQISYEMLFNCRCAAGATVPYCQIQLIWVDTVTGFTLQVDQFMSPMATQSGGFVIHGRGPTKANQLTVNVTNMDTVTAPSIAVTVLQNSRVHLTDEWNWRNDIVAGYTVPTKTLARITTDSVTLGYLNSDTVPASSTAAWLFGMGNGRLIQVSGNTSGVTPTNLTLTVFADPGAIYTGGGIVFRSVLAAAPFNFTFLAPRAPLLVQWTNSQAAIATISMLAVTQST